MSKVDHPSHYNNHPSGVECIDVIEHLPFNVGNVFKYLWRAGNKENEPTEDDFQKAYWYLKREMELRGYKHDGKSTQKRRAGRRNTS